MNQPSKKNQLINPRLQSGVITKRIARRTVSNGFGEGALVICNGEPPTRKLAQQLARQADLIVAADGGANVCRRLGIRPNLIIGDLDSITPTTKRYFSSQVKRLKPLRNSSGLLVPRPEGRGYTRFIRMKRQDNTDLEKALDFLVKRKIKRAIILAATGKRLDHTLGNLSVIWNYASSFDFSFAGNGWYAMPVGKKKTIVGKKGTTVSLLPFGACSGITLKGLFYPLTNATMNVGEIGVSNVVTKSPFTVEVKKGNLLMIILADYSSVKILS